MGSDSILSAVFDWTKKDPVLTAWAAVGLAILAAVVVWQAILYEAERAKNIEVNAGIERIREVISRFNKELEQYVEGCRRLKNPADRGLLRKPNRAAMEQLASMTVLQWPSVNSFEDFQAYWSRAKRLMEGKGIDEGSQLGGESSYRLLDHSLEIRLKPVESVLWHIPLLFIQNDFWLALVGTAIWGLGMGAHVWTC